jgi:hypothetical protein
LAEIVNPGLGQDGLLIRIEGGRSVHAAELGALLTALARDYRAMNRNRELAVYRVETGSILIEVKDAIAAAAPYLKDGATVAGGITALQSFGKAIKKLISSRKATSQSIEGRQGPYRSVEAIIKIAADAGAQVSGRQVGTDGSALEFQLTPQDAALIRARERSADSPEREIARLAPPHLALESRATKQFADDLEQLSLTGPNDTHPLVVSVVRLLKGSGNSHLLVTLERELKARGHNALAAALRHEAALP